MQGSLLQPVTPVRAGIAGGWVLLIEGDDHVGREVILASRLCDSAGPGQVLAPKELVSPLMNLTQTDLGEVMVDMYRNNLTIWARISV